MIIIPVLFFSLCLLLLLIRLSDFIFSSVSSFILLYCVVFMRGFSSSSVYLYYLCDMLSKGESAFG